LEERLSAAGVGEGRSPAGSCWVRGRRPQPGRTWCSMSSLMNIADCVMWNWLHRIGLRGWGSPFCIHGMCLDPSIKMNFEGTTQGRHHLPMSGTVNERRNRPSPGHVLFALTGPFVAFQQETEFRREHSGIDPIAHVTRPPLEYSILEVLLDVTVDVLWQIKSPRCRDAGKAASTHHGGAPLSRAAGHSLASFLLRGTTLALA
jgi:hypothetical protein